MKRALLLLSLTAVSACGAAEPTCKASYKDLAPDPAKVCTTAIDRDKDVCFAQPQICPSESPVNFCFQKVGLEYPPGSFLLTNYGEDPLVISKIEVLGDQRCSFGLQIDPPVGTPVKRGEAAVVQLAYDPKDEGADQVRLRITSNAENLPQLVLFACGTGIPATGDTDQACGPGAGENGADGFLCAGNDSEEQVKCE
jgi:hypothetical protein